MVEPTLTRIEWGTLSGTRPRSAGKNARLDDHGPSVRVPIARITASDGATGFGIGIGRIMRDDAAALVGTPVPALPGPLEPAWRGLEFPLWDLAARRAGVPVYRLLAPERTEPLRVPCYDTSLYIDDIHLDDEAAAALIAEEAAAGYAAGHRAFKIKLGRGARWMPLDAGISRDIAVVRAVREEVGADAKIMLDANNGYNLNITKHVLTSTADCRIHWMEEAFHEDAVLYRDLQDWLDREGLATLIGDGEGDASPHLMDWAREGIVDVVQYDIFSHGIVRWLETGRQLDEWGASTAPHHYGTGYGNYAAGHLAAAVTHFQFVEWDHADIPGLVTDAYTIDDGHVVIPEAPGFGLALDEAVFATATAITSGGFDLSA